MKSNVSFDVKGGGVGRGGGGWGGFVEQMF